MSHAFCSFIAVCLSGVLAKTLLSSWYSCFFSSLAFIMAMFHLRMATKLASLQIKEDEFKALLNIDNNRQKLELDKVENDLVAGLRIALEESEREADRLKALAAKGEADKQTIAAAEKAAVEAKEKAEALARKLEEKRNAYTTTIKYAEENTKLLKKQLMASNQRPLEYMPLPELKAEIAALMKLAQNGTATDKDSDRLDYLLTCLNHNEEYQAEQAEEQRQWTESVQDKAQEWLAEMRSFVPPFIFSATERQLVEEHGYSKALVRRLRGKKCLWLVRMQEQDIARLHGADLTVTYGFEGQRLDLVELGAMFAVCQSITFSIDGDGRKAQWRQRLVDAVKRYMKEEEKNVLAAALRRNPVYAGQLPAFADRDTIVGREVVSSDGAFVTEKPVVTTNLKSSSGSGSTTTNTRVENCSIDSTTSSSSNSSSNSSSAFAASRKAISDSLEANRSTTTSTNQTNSRSANATDANVLIAAVAQADPDGRKLAKSNLAAALQQRALQRAVAAATSAAAPAVALKLSTTTAVVAAAASPVVVPPVAAAGISVSRSSSSSSALGESLNPMHSSARTEN